MLAKEPLLVIFVKLLDRIPLAEEPAKRQRGRPKTYPERLILKALVIMVIRRLYTAYSLLAFLDQKTELTLALRALLTENGRFPDRRTWERRLAKLPDSLPGLIGCFGRYLVQEVQPWGQDGRAAAIDSTPLRAKGGVWHKKGREAGVVPHSTIDIEAHWSKSGYHGWWYGWKLHLVSTAAALWIPLAAQLTPANVADQEEAPALVRELPPDIRYILGDTHYNDPGLRLQCEQAGRFLIATHKGTHPHQDFGAKVRQLFHRLRSKAIEPFNGLFKNVFEWGGQVPVRGLQPTRLIVLGAVFLYQLVLLYQFEHNLPLGKGVKPLLRAA
jgi:DDE family transposase